MCITTLKYLVSTNAILTNHMYKDVITGNNDSSPLL